MLKISDRAIQEFKTIIRELNTPEAGIRVFSKSGGCCSGHGIGLDLARESQNPHTQHDYDGLKVFIENDAMPAVETATIDYFPDAQNPGFRLLGANNASNGGCGCG
jgi:iron-sulfur cluster assembly accessory protein